MRTEACLRGQYSVCLRRFKASPHLLCAKGTEWEGAGMAVMMVRADAILGQGSGAEK